MTSGPTWRSDDRRFEPAERFQYDWFSVHTLQASPEPLNQWGREGWDVVFVEHARGSADWVFLMKRRIPS